MCIRDRCVCVCVCVCVAPIKVPFLVIVHIWNGIVLFPYGGLSLHIHKSVSWSVGAFQWVCKQSHWYSVSITKYGSSWVRHHSSTDLDTLDLVGKLGFGGGYMWLLCNWPQFPHSKDALFVVTFELSFNSCSGRPCTWLMSSKQVRVAIVSAGLVTLMKTFIKKSRLFWEVPH